MKVQGPMHSDGASGSFAGVMTAATWKGRPYMRQLVKPSNPKSAMQTATRAMFRFLSQAWAGLADADKSSWEAKAASGNYSPFNAYQAYNMDLWSRALPPTKNSVPDPQGNGTADTWTATAGVRSITLNIALDPGEFTWGAIIYQEIGSAPEGTQDEVVWVENMLPAQSKTILLTGLTPGLVYHFKYRVFDDGGTLSALSADVSATPTA